MGDGLSIGKTWTVTVPSDSARTINSNLWQYSVFPYTTPPSVMYPCDALSSMNDTQLMNFDYSVGSFMDMSTSLYANLMPMMKQWMAQQAEMYKKIMENLHSNTRITNPNPSDDDDDTSKIDGKKHVKEAKVVETLQRMANNPDIKSRFNTEITYTNKEGKDVKAKLIDRLTALCEEYRKSPDTAELSEDNFNTIWDIAGKFVKTGELTTADYKALLEIAKNPEGPGAYKKSDDDDDDGDKNTTIERSENYKNGYMAKEANKSTGDLFFDAINGPGTNKGKMKDACEATNKFNVIEVLDAYNSTNSYENAGETWIEAVFDDCDNWGSGEGGKWYCFGMDDDDAKPYVDKLSHAMIERAADVSELANCSEENKKALTDKAKALENALRGNDFVARIDDNEFAIYIASLNKDFAKNVVSRVWEAVHAIEIKKSEKEMTNVELLVGVCSSDCGSDLDDLTKKARLALSTTQTRHSIGFYSTDMAVADEKKQRSYRAKSVVSKSDFKQKNVAKNTHKDNKHSIPVAKVKSKAAEKKS